MNFLKVKSAVSADFLAVRIEGERIILAPVSYEHDQDIFTEFTEDITRYMIPEPLADMAHAYEFVDTCRKNMKAGLELVLAITNVNSGEFLGICAIHEWLSWGYGLKRAFTERILAGKLSGTWQNGAGKISCFHILSTLSTVTIFQAGKSRNRWAVLSL